MGLFGPILAATGLSPSSTAALREAHALSIALQTRLTVCHILPELYRARVLFPQEAGADRVAHGGVLERSEEAVRTEMRTALGSAADELPIEFETGSPHAGILAVARRVGAGLVVVGSGHTAQRVARAGDGLLLVARESPAGGAVLGATDFSDPSLPAIRMAAAEAARRGARLRLVHCLDVDATAYLVPMGAAGLVGAAPFPESAVTELEAEARARLEAAAPEGAAAEALVVRLSPYRGILQAATERPTSLIVVGTHGRSGLARLALGSVAESVMRDAPCSVLVVPIDRH
jgi:nucleotide-binding universal stress UspA family protein